MSRDWLAVGLLFVGLVVAIVLLFERLRSGG